MLDIALFDILAKKAELPLYKLLGGYRHSIHTSITIGIKPLDETLEIAKKYWHDGFKILKLKGGLDLHEDVEKVIKLREVLGNSLALRFDANQGYTEEQALEFINLAKAAEIEIFEQPTHHANLEAMQSVSQGSPVPVMGDESIRSLKDAMHFVKQDAIDMISIKLQKVGGILESTHINSVAKSNRLEVMVSCLDECSLGIAAGLHFCLSKPNLLYADLDGHLDMLNDPYQNLFDIRNGKMKPNGKPGLGL
jgi:L-alanine-DL-glutamate epimerase-like enolase superfamily enzyme